MKSVLEIAWLIPFAPSLGAFVVFIFLVSFNKTINRLTKPVSYFLIVCVATSTALSFLLFQKHLTGQVLDLNLLILNLKLHLELYVDNISAIAATVFGLVSLVVMTCSYYLMDRKKGYVLYFVLLGLLCGSIFSFILSGDIFHRYF